ncbi:hypothetical protein Tco_1362229 [Tanacetum coccineum]
MSISIDRSKALELTYLLPFVLKYPSSSPIPVVDSDFLIEEVDTFLVSEDSIPPGIESDFDSEGDIIFLNDLLNDDPIPEYERFTFDIEPDAPVINNFDELNEDKCFDPGGGRCLKEKLSGSNFNDWFRSPKLVLRVEKKLSVIEQPIPPAHATDSKAQVLAEWNTIYDAHNEELKSMFEKQAGVERFDLIQTFHACKQEEGKSVSSYVLKMKGNYNMHNMEKTISELHALLIEYDKGNGKGKDKGNDKPVYIPKPKNHKPSAKEHPTKLIEEVMADMGKKSSMKTFVPNDKADYYSRITSLTVNGKNAYELKGKFLNDLHNNAFWELTGKDAVGIIEYLPEIFWTQSKLPNVDH